jgi:gamma-glutamyl:cysteine ligase YbdK (ATP-grasp superfamily)
MTFVGAPPRSLGWLVAAASHVSVGSGVQLPNCNALRRRKEPRGRLSRVADYRPTLCASLSSPGEDAPRDESKEKETFALVSNAQGVRF